MNFSAVHGFNAYTQFTAQVREAVKVQELGKESVVKNGKTDSEFGSPVDSVSISRSAFSRSQALSQKTQNESPQTILKDWIKASGNTNNAATQRVTSQTTSELLATNGIQLEEKETYSVDMDVWCAVSVTEKNAEKAKAIQNLLHNTPSGINWGFFLQKLPVDN